MVRFTAIIQFNRRCSKTLSHLNVPPLFTVSPNEIQAGENTNATLPYNVSLPVSKADITNQSLVDASWIRNGIVIASFTEALSEKQGEASASRH